MTKLLIEAWFVYIATFVTCIQIRIFGTTVPSWNIWKRFVVEFDKKKKKNPNKPVLVTKVNWFFFNLTLLLLFGCCSLRILISLDHREGFFFFERYSLGLLGNDTVLVDCAIFISLFLHKQDINGGGSIFNLLNKKKW